MQDKRFIFQRLSTINLCLYNKLPLLPKFVASLKSEGFFLAMYLWEPLGRQMGEDGTPQNELWLPRMSTFYTALTLPGIMPASLRYVPLWKTSFINEDLQNTAWGCANLTSLTVGHQSCWTWNPYGSVCLKISCIEKINGVMEAVLKLGKLKIYQTVSRLIVYMSFFR